MKTYHVLNLGAGVQSTTLYLMFMDHATWNLPSLDAAIFADTQDEPPDVYRHLEWLESLAGPRIIRCTKGKLSDDLLAGVNSTGNRFISIPAFTASPEGEEEGRLKRQCSKEYKIEVISKALREEVLGITKGARVSKIISVVQYIGISFDESRRAFKIEKRKRPKYLGVAFPLRDRFLTRANCEHLLYNYFHVPHTVPRSACVYCPFHSDAEWLRIKADPRAWAEVVKIDEALRSPAVTANRQRKNTQPMFLHRSLQPLIQITFDANPSPRAEQININFARECMGVCGV